MRDLGLDDVRVQRKESSLIDDHDLIKEDDEYSAGGQHDLQNADMGCVGSSLQYSRKEKSLGELCRRFLGLYGSQSRSLLYLDQCTRELAVERRRIYDIINILESFQVINRQAKNAYHWKGIHKIVKSIEKQIVRLPSFLDETMFRITSEAILSQFLAPLLMES